MLKGEGGDGGMNIRIGRYLVSARESFHPAVRRWKARRASLSLLGVEGLRIQRCEGELDDVDGDLMLKGAEVWGVGCGGGR